MAQTLFKLFLTQRLAALASTESITVLGALHAPAAVKAALAARLR